MKGGSDVINGVYSSNDLTNSCGIIEVNADDLSVREILPEFSSRNFRVNRWAQIHPVASNEGE